MRKPHLDPDLDAQLASATALDDEDADDLASATAPDDDRIAASLNRKQFTLSRDGVNGFSVVPLWVTREIARARAYHAAPFINAILQRMRVRKTTTVPITSAIWAEVASPGKYERETILKHLRRVPGVLRLEERHQRFTRYQAVLGDKWSRLQGAEIVKLKQRRRIKNERHDIHGHRPASAT